MVLDNEIKCYKNYREPTLHLLSSINQQLFINTFHVPSTMLSLKRWAKMKQYLPPKSLYSVRDSVCVRVCVCVCVCVFVCVCVSVSF